MLSASIPDNESLRLQALYESELLDTPQESEFNEIVKLASELCEMPISLISLVDADRQWFKARIGLDVAETNRDVSFCSHAILQDSIFEVPDTFLDNRFFDNPLVTDFPSIRFYAGVPLITKAGSRLGTLCVIDKNPRVLNMRQKFALQVLANNVIKIAELRIKNRQLNYLTQTQERIISVLAHDVRNPLASIKSIIDYRKADYLDAEAADEMLDMASVQLDSTIQMVSNIVNWGHLQLKFNAGLFENVQVKGLVEHIFESEVLNAHIKNNILVNSVDDSILFFTEKEVLEFVMRNLVSNANKFTENGSITINATLIADKLQIKITDTGMGMDQQTADALFTDAKHVSTPGTRAEKGNGLGLLLVKEFVARLRGEIKVNSEPGLGTVFKITI